MLCYCTAPSAALYRQKTGTTEIREHGCRPARPVADPRPDHIHVCSRRYLTGYSVRTEFPKSQRRLNPPEQRHDIQVFDPTSEEKGGTIHSLVTRVLSQADHILDSGGDGQTYLASGSYSDQILLNSSR